MIVLPDAPMAGQPSACPEACIPSEAAWVEGIRLGTTIGDVERILGKPVGRTIAYGEDDGGRYDEIRLSYPGLDIYLVRGIVDRVIATAATSCTANGICPGMQKDEVRSRIAGISKGLVDSELSSFYICFERCNDDFYLLIDYGATGEVERVSIETDRP